MKNLANFLVWFGIGFYVAAIFNTTNLSILKTKSIIFVILVIVSLILRIIDHYKKTGDFNY